VGARPQQDLSTGKPRFCAARQADNRRKQTPVSATKAASFMSLIFTLHTAAPHVHNPIVAESPDFAIYRAADLVFLRFELIFTRRLRATFLRDSVEAEPMSEFDYKAAAELFPTRRRIPRRQPLGYKRFAQAAQAIRFAMEDVAPELLVGACLEVDEQRYGSADIRRLYESAEYPLARRGARS
jgi:hypothetical protein